MHAFLLTFSAGVVFKFGHCVECFIIVASWTFVETSSGFPLCAFKVVYRQYILSKNAMDKTFIFWTCRQRKFSYSLTCMHGIFHFGDCMRIRSFSNCTVRVVFYHFYMCVIIIISLFVHRLFCYAICSSRYDCSFFYLQQYFSSSSYLTLLGSVLCFVHSAVRCPLLLLQFFGYCCWIPTSFNLTNSPFRSFHTARFFTHSVLYAKCEYIVFIA